VCRVLVGEEVGKEGSIYLGWGSGIREGWKAVPLATIRETFGSPYVLGSSTCEELLSVIHFGLFDCLEIEEAWGSCFQH